jgi:N-acetylglucosaminyl-diphospho-decaprenol L-rhamnosyltransferase
MARRFRGHRGSGPLPVHAADLIDLTLETVEMVTDLAVVVVNHDAGDALGTFLQSLRVENVTEMIVVDNASSDGSSDGVDADPHVRVVRTGANLGYGAGANRGLAATDAEFVLISNPDVSVHPGALTALMAAFGDDPTLAIAGPRILNVDGTRYPSARRFPSLAVAAGHTLLGLLAPQNRFTARYRMAELDPAVSSPGRPVPPPGGPDRAGPDRDVPGHGVPGHGGPGDGGPDQGGPGTRVPVDWVSGACFMARHRALKDLGGFDESYFMYLEDLDLCWRAHRAGWGVAYVPSAAVTHLQGLSTARRPYRMLLAHHRSAFQFASRTATGWRRVTLPGVAVALTARFAVASARQALGTLHKNAGQGD